ncbi:hypothetical protein D9M69_528500 [compost metagenome]
MHGFIFGVVQVGGIGVEVVVGRAWDVIEARSLATSRNTYVTIALGGLDGLARPQPGMQVVGRTLVAQQVHRHLGELQRRAALDEQDLVLARHP